jgi:hypothetical protein
MDKERVAAIAIALLGCGLFRIAAAAPVQWKSAEGGNDHVYDIVVNDSHDCSEVMNGIRFKEAVSEANAMGGYLATPNLTGEASFIYDNLVAPAEDGKDQRYWLGGHCTDGCQSFHWVTGEPVTGWGGYTMIDGADSEVPHGIVQGGEFGAALQDLPQNRAANGFVVEFDTPPKGDAEGEDGGPEKATPSGDQEPALPPGVQPALLRE